MAYFHQNNVASVNIDDKGTHIMKKLTLLIASLCISSLCVSAKKDDPKKSFELNLASSPRDLGKPSSQKLIQQEKTISSVEIIKLDLSGFTLEDITIECDHTNHMLIIRAEQKSEKKGPSSWSHETISTSYQIPLAKNAITEKITSDLSDDGTLTIRIPLKTEPSEKNGNKIIFEIEDQKKN